MQRLVAIAFILMCQYAPPYIIDSLRYAHLGSDKTGGGRSLPGLRFRRVRLMDLGGAAALPVSGDEFGTRKVKLWDTAEWAINYPSYAGNPFDLQASVTFTHRPSGEKRTTGMFYDSKIAWRFRFAATRPGTWTFVTQCDGGNNTDCNRELHGFSGQVMVSDTAGNHPNGFLTHFGNKWCWQGTGEALIPQYVMGKDADWFYDFENSRVDPAKIDADIQLFMKEHGFTGFHLHPPRAWFALRGEVGAAPNPDPRTYDVVEAIVRKVHAQGGACHIWMWGSDGKTKGEGLRYILDGPMCAADQRNLRYTSYRPLYDRYVEAIEHQPGRPSFEEDRFRLRNRKQWVHKDYSLDLTVKGLWHSAMAGGVANIWGNLLPSDNEGGSQSYDHGDVKVKDRIKTYATFFCDRKRFRRDFVRDNALAEPHAGTTEVPEAASISVCLRNADHTRFVFYRERTDTVAMDLSGCRIGLPAVAVDTRKAYAEIDLGLLRPAKHTWQAPYESNWAIAVGTF